MNSVASEEKFRLKVHRAMVEQADRPLHLASGIGKPGAAVTDHGYTHDASNSLDPEAEVIDLATLELLSEEGKTRDSVRVKECLAAMREVRDVLDQKVKENPALSLHVGKYLWQIRGRITEIERSLKGKMAA